MLRVIICFIFFLREYYDYSWKRNLSKIRGFCSEKKQIINRLLIYQWRQSVLKLKNRDLFLLLARTISEIFDGSCLFNYKTAGVQRSQQLLATNESWFAFFHSSRCTHIRPSLLRTCTNHTIARSYSFHATFLTICFYKCFSNPTKNFSTWYITLYYLWRYLIINNA